MKITGEGTTYWNRVRAVYKQNEVARPGEGAGRPRWDGDSVQLSAAGRLVGELKARLAEADDVRHGRVETLQAAVAAGTYKVPLEDVADAILKEMSR
ncbi:flagellar biosynthesis anti-sigma factor FlgM [Neomoorella humiferrea]|uniref:flagellar biosynthesis anti-sigma factor FlgM n=1 Tax=Neomoorella humiferrea TaxID=676965 RepID=UPI003D92B94D